MFEKFKIKKQRAKKGYSYMDLCDISYFFQTTFVKMIREFEEQKIGSPDLPFEEVDHIELRDFYNDIIYTYNKQEN